ncbi:hypothetical protein QL285_017365 [Trifolium repens]|nr:hypothetical protein QL285_017365 [Trifolium repens]
MDVRGELMPLSVEEVSLRKRWFEVLWHLLKGKESVLMQRSRSKWLTEGDYNTKFFHACIKSRGSRNYLNALKVDNSWLESPTEIRQAVVSYFANHFQSSMVNRPRLDGIVFPVISDQDNSLLSERFSLEEIHGVVMDCDGNKSPGPDGFNFSFIKSFWYLLKDEVNLLFQQFYDNELLPKSFSSYFVALIPKVKSPFELNDYRPISLLGCLYKIVAKVLASRLAKVMGSIIAPNQSAFLKGRLLVDGVLVVNEVVDLAKRSGKDCMIFKVDFEKAYDSVDWNFLDYMLRRFGFGDKWRAWIRACVFAGNMSVLVNGSATSEVSIQRGLKQGDPLAPFLFLLVAEGLGGLMRTAVERHRFSGFVVGSNGVSVSHLQYADDTLCIGEASIENLWSLKAILRGFEKVSGLKVNFAKSCVIGVNVSDNFIRLASAFLNCRVGSVPFKYLGLPVGANPRRATAWEPMLVALRNRLGEWSNKYVSLGGRIVLLNAVLNAIPIFFLSFMKIPILVWKKVRRIQREFLWGSRNGRRRISWVKWDTVCKPKKWGGLGVRDIRAVNISLLAKWRWRLLHSDGAIWKDVIKAKYGEAAMGRVCLEDDCKPWFSSLWWKDIHSIGENLEVNWFMQGVRKVMGNGMNTNFWCDVWVGSVSLRERFPRLFSISLQQNDSVSALRGAEDGVERWNFVWRRRLFVWEENLLSDLREVINNVTLVNERDRWGWIPNAGGDFSVKSAYDTVVKLFVPMESMEQVYTRAFATLWKCVAPSKVLGFAWQLLLERIPTRCNLARRQIQLLDNEQRCVWCGREDETVMHLFIYCDFARQVWMEIFNWLGVTFSLPHNLFSILNLFRDCYGKKQRRKGVVLIWAAVVWALWRMRNTVIFENGTTSSSSVVEDIKLSAWKWWVGRLESSAGCCLFYEWQAEPLLCMDRS